MSHLPGWRDRLAEGVYGVSGYTSRYHSRVVPYHALENQCTTLRYFKPASVKINCTEYAYHDSNASVYTL